MQIVLIKPSKLNKYPFPSDNIVSYWISDIDENNADRDLLLIEKKENAWFLFSGDSCYIEVNGQKVHDVKLTMNTFYSLKISEINNRVTSAFLYVYKENDPTYQTYALTENKDYLIGSASHQNIILSGNDFIADNHAILSKNERGFSIRAIDTKYGVYVNNNRVDNKALESGDSIFLFGYTIIVLDNYIIVNNPFNGLRISSENIISKPLPQTTTELLPTQEDDLASLYQENDYFSRQPRFTTSVKMQELKIDNPPAEQKQDDTPVLLTVGPMLTMTMTSAVSVFTSINNYMSGKSTFAALLPSLIIAGAMLASTILWPTLLRKYNKKKQKENEAERQSKYSYYLAEKRMKITNIRNNQYQVLVENFPEPKDLKNIIMNRKRNLWERQISSEDFLNVRLGIGTIPLKLKLAYGSEDFTMVEDNLKEELNKVASTARDIPNSPVTIDLTERNKLVMIGETYYKESMLKSLLLQLVTYHAYNDLKLVFMLNDTSSPIWEDVKILPHAWSDAKDVRFFATTYDEMSKLSFYLEQVYMARKYSDDDNGKKSENDITFRDVQPYYLIIVDNIRKNKNIEIIDKILKEEGNLGFGLIILNDGISNLPNECNDFLTLDGKSSAILKSDLNKENQQSFAMDNTDDINLGILCEKLSNIPIKAGEGFDELKSSVGFLEMYKVGRVEQLNVLDRWENNNPVNSLSVPIGVRTDGELFTLDLHEKFHGPHGLIAGMTGSGKSEFIITFILSMCLNFSPEEVSFVLIDYKGGGLTGAFENKLTGVRLPHLAGTITNLDTAEIKRSLSSIQSELKRRQGLFNDVKARLNESTLDIYKYQQLYRAGKIKEPISHLFIVSDEFAELKSQQSDFMNELISTARIGRSLGVHLILATQKPAGVVDDQIWSNSKFKVCLKVQERADSMDVIKRPDAVTLKKAGRFYLQVGYNDFFAIGQSAYSGTKYIPKDKISKLVNRDVTFVNNIGDAIKTVETVKRQEGISQGEELPNVLREICAAAKAKNVVAKKLWLDKIPAEIFVSNLIKKYKFVSKPWEIKAIIGEYDDPNNQRQDLMVLDFNEGGNTLIYGASGKEIMISSIIYSLIVSHTSEELNIYIIDFGSEMLGIFKSAPQVGDVVFVNEEEKLVNLFNTITKELERRKKLFSDYNGSYNLYIKNSGKTLPQIIIIVNSYEVLAESYDDYVSTIASITRECEKYGISFVMSATGVNGIRGKTTQNFNKQYCLQFNDPSDYMNILGHTHGMVPSEIEGRGLFKLNGEIYEFQTAYPYKWDEINTFIKNVCTQLSQKVATKASTIAILPNHVRYSDITNKITDIRRVPIGIEKDTLAIATFDFGKNPLSLVSAQEISILEKFVPSLAQVLQAIGNVNLYVVDPGNSIKDPTTFNNYYSDDMNEVFAKMESCLESNDGKVNTFLIYGVEAFFQAFDQDALRKVKTFLSNTKNHKTIRVILADGVTKIKAIEYEDFYRNCVQAMYAVWIGSGITDQFTIKSSTYNKVTRSQIENDFGYNVDRGQAILIKTLDFYSEEF